MAGVIDVLTAVTPPLRGRLHLVLELLPYVASQTAGALVALIGIGLLALARGVRRGQRRAFVHRALGSGHQRGAAPGARRRRGGSLFSLGVVGFLRHAPPGVPGRRRTGPRCARPSSPCVGGVVGITVVSHRAASSSRCASTATDPACRCGGPARPCSNAWWDCSGVSLPDRLDDFLVSQPARHRGQPGGRGRRALATRPLVDRRRSGGRAAEARARDIVRRHGQGTLDYFALRSDKQWFFHRDSLVAYAIYSGICLVSPDPIGPAAEHEQVWAAFRRFADDRGWVVTVMGAGEHWLPIYRATGMHDIYIGDEAVVDVQEFSLAGGHMKGLRQAYNRIAKYGYTASFHDPGRLDRETRREQLTGLMSQGRRGEFERGFSMVLGRIFDPRDENLILCMVTGPDGKPAAMCQFVPARGIGGYSLDLMRRDRGEHPNGLIDFALVSTIEHLRNLGCQGISLNFAALRSVLEGVRGDGPTQRVERWALKKMSSVPADRDAVAVQRQVRARVAAPLRRVRRRRAPRARGARHLAGRIAFRVPRHRADDRGVGASGPRRGRRPGIGHPERRVVVAHRDARSRRRRSPTSPARTAHLRTHVARSAEEPFPSTPDRWLTTLATEALPPSSGPSSAPAPPDLDR